MKTLNISITIGSILLFITMSAFSRLSQGMNSYDESSTIQESISTAIPPVSGLIPKSLYTPTTPTIIQNETPEMTLMLNQCFDLNTGQDVVCDDPNADFKYTYLNDQSAKIIPLNSFSVSRSRETKPSLYECQAEDYFTLPLEHPLPVENSTEKYYCWQNEYQEKLIFGWYQPVYFNSGGITFIYDIYSDSDIIDFENAVPAPNPLILNSNEQKTLLIEKCFDFIDGQRSACNGTEADFKFTSGQQQLELHTLNDTRFAVLTTSQPSLSTCQNAQLMSGVVFMQNTPPSYPVCFSTKYNGNTVYGWFQPYSYNDSGITFKYYTYTP